LIVASSTPNSTVHSRRTWPRASSSDSAATSLRETNADGSVERLFRTSHKLVGTMNALAELDLLYLTLTGSPKLETSDRLRSALTRVAWQ
jgi:hypothetical protein